MTNKVWNVYFRQLTTNRNEDGEWQWQWSIPPMIVETFEKDGKTSSGDRWYNDGNKLDLAEGRAAMLVLQNQKMGFESRYEWEENTDSKTQKPVAVTFNCKLH